MRHYTRVNMLLPKKPATLTFINEIIEKLNSDFDGDTHRTVIVVSEAKGDWFDKQKREFIGDQHISIDIDIDPASSIDIEPYFVDLKKACEKIFHETEIWITYSSVARIA